MPNLCKLGDVYLTVVKEEQINFSNSITEKNVEDGATITDHARKNMIGIQISGYIFDNKEYPEATINQLRRYSVNRTILKYYGVNNWRSCIMESFDFKHSAEIGLGIEYTIQLKEVNIVNKTYVSINASKLSIPNIEALKEQLEAQKEAKEEAKRAKLEAQKNKGKQTKK
ncbi:phage baseplate protein [Clostridium botulinum]|uniref:phage baseplate protein n=1 Tax=Clostridium botulinum TaxID=1491 RepID=UPI000774DE06|nr:hypothetical protein [Clostridium botulinum]